MKKSNANLLVNTNLIVKKVKKNDTLSPTIYSPASVVDNITKVTENSKSNKVWKKSKLAKSTFKI